MVQATEFIKDCYAITRYGHPMPGHFKEINKAGFAVVIAPNGREYSFPADALLTVEEAEEHLRSQRVQFVAVNYSFEPVSKDRWQTVVKCSHPEHPSRSYLLTLRKNRQTCNCPAYVKAGDCKHLGAYRMIHGTDEQPAQAPETPASTYTVGSEW